ncbi:MAG: polyphosphate kinase 1, partial [Eudoraea sp.]|nr:polyphosphate kinase 1 [Eudoraea sp.]NNJ39362.1 polyphosphate kinase 1 [Eudoraea sp.]
MAIHKYQYINREISWLQFNERVLQESADQNVPLIERLRFLGIFSNNLDEFFKVRYATVKRIVLAGKKGKSVLGGETAKELLAAITKIVIEQQTKSLEYLHDIEKELESHHIYVIKESELTQKQADYVVRYFVQHVSPQLMTLILNDLTKFPTLKDAAAYLVVKMVMKSEEDEADTGIQKEKRYALIEIPKAIHRFIVLPKEGEKRFIIILDDLIRYCLDRIFSMFEYESISAHMIKITRDAELDIDNDLSKSFIEKLSTSVAGRKISDPVRFIYDKKIAPDTLQFLKDKMNTHDTDSIIPGGRYHNRKDYMSFPSLGREDLLYEKITPLQIKGLSLESSLFEAIAKKDYLMYVPYHTFSYLIKFLREAALDPNVRSIKITIYRLATDSQVISSLINAAKNGKQVTVQI